MEKKDSPVLFDSIAKTYDKINRILSLGLHSSWRAQVAKRLPSTPNLTLLDCATGTCDQLLTCLKQCDNITSAVGIDLSKEMLNIGKHKITKTPYTYKTRLELACVSDIPYADASFDAATISFGIRNLEDPLKGLSEIYRVLKPGGTLLILEFSKPKYFPVFHLWYLRHIVPHIGQWLSGHKEAYSYLNTTIESFPYGAQFCALMSKASFTHITCTPLTGGIVSIYAGTKCG